jgi:nuclear transport factor 2 (NTF2) superfamily protein
MNTDSKPTTSTETRPPLPPFTRESAIEKVRLAEDDWNSRDPSKVADPPISESDHKYYWPLGRRPDDHLGLTDLGL